MDVELFPLRSGIVRNLELEVDVVKFGRWRMQDTPKALRPKGRLSISRRDS